MRSNQAIALFDGPGTGSPPIIDAQATAIDFGVNIIPHTFEKTVFKHYTTGTIVNLEVDLVARYTARLLTTRTD